MLYGLERFPLGEVEVYEGESDVEKLWEKLSTGKYLLYAAPVDDNGKVETEWIKHQVGGMLTLVIGIIGILNFINSILTGIVTRQKEFAMMESIGMTKKQLTRMLIYEGLYYAGITIVTSLVMGSLFSLTVVRALSGGMWFMKYHFVIGPMLLVFPVLLVLGVVVPVIAGSSQRKVSLIERIRQD